MIVRIAPEKRQQIYWTVTLLVTVLITISSTIYSLSLGIYEVFPFIYFLPIILFVYFYPEKGVYFSVALSSVYILLVYTVQRFQSKGRGNLHCVVCDLCYHWRRHVVVCRGTARGGAEDTGESLRTPRPGYLPSIWIPCGSPK